MALWLEQGSSDEITAEAQADLDAISAVKESAAIELKEKGNEFMKMGKNHYKDAIDCYTRAIQQKSMDTLNTAVLYANRSQAHLLLGNYRRSLTDAQEALKLNKSYVKAYFRGAKAAVALESFEEAAELCTAGIEYDRTNMELLELKKIIDKKFSDAAEHKRKEALVVSEAELLLSALLDRGIRMGKPSYKEHIAGRKPWLDKSKLLHWPVLFLYPESMATDFVEDFCEVESFSSHLDTIFGEDASPLPWDHKRNYTRDNVTIFYEATARPPLSRKQILATLLEGKNIHLGKDTQDLDLDDLQIEDTTQKWIHVSERLTLNNVLTKKNYVVPGAPVFYILSKDSDFYGEFLARRWSAP